jgi:hypothetical protein
MHETLSPSFKGYVDNFTVTDGNLRFSGWLITTENRDNVVYYINAGHDIAFYNYNDRSDVSDFYKTQQSDYVKCGFDINIPLTSNNELITVFALINSDDPLKTRRENIFTLNLMQNQRVQPVSTFVEEKTLPIKIRKNIVPELVVVDNFYEDPDMIRQLALQQDFAPDIRYHKGNRTSKKFLAPNTKQMFESLLGRRITRWHEFEYNGVFQYCTAEDPIVYHSDVQSYAAAVYLTPNAPVTCGTSFFRSREYPDVYKTWTEGDNYEEIFKGGYYDKTKFELVDTVGNVYNRLTIWNSHLIHSATEYFGTDKYNSRLFHLFFFDIEE